MNSDPEQQAPGSSFPETVSDSHASSDDQSSINEQRSRKSYWSIGAPSLAGLRRFRYSKIRDVYSSKGKQLVEHLNNMGNADNIPLPFANRIYGPGEEWIKGVILCSWGTGLILVINIILTAVAAGMAYTKASNQGNVDKAVVYEGRCSLTDGWKTGLHFLINVLSTGLLAASNYVMQCLCAPSRASIDRAHAKKRWLDIGTLSLRNFTEMDTRRKVLWVILLMSSLPIHMLFNSAVFSSITWNEFETVTIPTDLAPDEPLVDENSAQAFQQSTKFSAEHIRSDLVNGALQNISVSDCQDKRNENFRKGIGLVLFVTNREFTYPENGGETTNSIEALEYQYTGSRRLREVWNQENGWYVSPEHWRYPEWEFRDPSVSLDEWEHSGLLWHRASYEDRELYKDIDTVLTYIYVHNPDVPQLRSLLDTSSTWDNVTWARQLEIRISEPSGPTSWHYGSHTPWVHASHCLIKPIKEGCELYFNVPICLAVIACNIIKLICMCLAAKTRHKEILLTVGDALASFLDQPDVTTKGKCLMSWTDFADNSGRTSHPTHQTVATSTNIPLIILGAEQPMPASAYSQIRPRRKRWCHAVSWRRWTVTIVFFLACLTVSIYLYYLGVQSISRFLFISYPLATNMGIGKTSSEMLIDGLGDVNITALILLANTPQLVFSVLYYLCNSILSSMLAAAEYDNFADRCKPLRVSWPRGLQRSTYYLSIPWRYGIPLLAISVTLHWLLSQSIFPVIIEKRGPNNNRLYETQSCGFSLFGMFLTLLIGTVAVIVLGGLGMRPLRSHMPLAGSCSLAIAAACHPPEDDSEASLKPVMWGEVCSSGITDSGGNTDAPDESSDESSSGSSDGLSGGPSNESQADEAGPRYAHCTFTSKEVVPPSLTCFYR